MEAELVHLRKEIDAKFIQTRYENTSKILDEIITTQRYPSNKNGIGFSQTEILVSSKYYAAYILNAFKKKEEQKERNAQNCRRSFHPIKKEFKTTPRKVYKTSILTFSWVIVLHAPILDTNL